MGRWHNNSDSDEVWDGEWFETREEAILDGVMQYKNAIKGMRTELFEDYEVPNPYFFVGEETEKFVPHINADSIIDNVREQAYWEYGEVSESWLYHISNNDFKTLEDMLDKTFAEWLSLTNNNPGFYNIVNVEKIMVADYL